MSLLATFKCIICIQTAQCANLCRKCSCLFCARCITQWLKSSNECPHCRLTMSGSDLVRLAWLDDFIPPFRDLLDRHELSDPIDEKESDKKWIVVSGEGLHKGFVGVETGFSIDYAGAEMGSLSIQTRGPSKLDLQCTYHEEESQTEVKYTPDLPGNYQILVYYDDVQVEGSPYNLDVDVLGDKAALVQTYGQGLKDCYVNKDNFIFVDYSGLDKLRNS